jgi:hypothetical protein
MTAGGTLAMSSSFMRNRIINGAMVVDQRNAGASVTASTTSANVYTLDRWAYYVTAASKFTVQQNAGSVTPPSGFTNYLGATSSSAYSVASGDILMIRQGIEGFNVSDLGWGAAGAKSVTLSFWVRSSLTGTFGGAICNNAGDRSYPFSYSIGSANTWTQISVTVSGDTSGTWLTTNGVGIYLQISLGTGTTYSGTAGAWAGSFYASATGATSVVGTNGATFYITGVQLEVGTVATPFERRLYGAELALCQRYLPAFNFTAANQLAGWGQSITSTESLISIPLPVTPRIAPTGVTTSAMSGFTIRNGSNAGGTPTSIAVGSNSAGNFYQISVVSTAGSPTLTAGQGAFLLAGTNAQILLTGCEL